jgi:uncharacterized protein (UPF0335 family)
MPSANAAGGRAKKSALPTSNQTAENQRIQIGNFDNDKLQSYVDRIENLESEKAALSSDISDVYSEADSSGFNKKALREIIRKRKMSDNDRQALEYEVACYERTLGMQLDLLEN